MGLLFNINQTHLLHCHHAKLLMMMCFFYIDSNDAFKCRSLFWIVGQLLFDGFLQFFIHVLTFEFQDVAFSLR